MTGTPLDLTPFGVIVKGIGLLYWIAALTCAGLALWWFKRWWLKLGAAVAILATFITPAAQHVWDKQQQYDAVKAELDATTAHFEMRCKNAGEKITRTVENVEGVVWMRLRDKNLNESKQFWLDDPYGQDCTATDCIEQLLRITKGLELDPKKEQLRHFGYQFVESPDAQTRQLNRYTLGLYRKGDRDPRYGKNDIRTELLPESIERASARYGVKWDDISTQEDRNLWIAGGSLQVIDLQTDEVIAERIGYMMDRGLGNRFNGRSPWRHARRTLCPGFAEERVYPNTETLIFVSKVLQLSKAN